MRLAEAMFVVAVAGCDRGAPAKQTVPTFTASLLVGGDIDTSRFVGRRPIVLIFWSTWCDPCISQLPHLARFHAQYRDRIEMISVAVDDADELPALKVLVANHGVSYPVAIDLGGGTVLPRFSQSTGLPLILVVDAKGYVQFVQRNYAPGDEHALGTAIEQVARAGS